MIVTGLAKHKTKPLDLKQGWERECSSFVTESQIHQKQVGNWNNRQSLNYASQIDQKQD